MQDGGKIKRQKNIDHHSPMHIPIICHLRDRPHFSLVPTFKRLVQKVISYHWSLCMRNPEPHVISQGEYKI